MADTSPKKVAILATDGVEQSELYEPRRALIEAGFTTELIAPQSGEIRAWRENNWGDPFRVDRVLDEARVDEFDALMLPGGVKSPDTLRMNPHAIDFIRSFFDSGHPIAAICHGPWLLAEADVLRGRTVTSWPSIKTDLSNAGATWIDQAVVTDQGLVTSRKPADIAPFTEKFIEAIRAGIHKERTIQRAA